jgi:lactate permease
MMFSQFQFEAAMSLSISPSLIIATQAIGATAGNMIAIQNVVASATVGLLWQEGATLRRTILPTIYYVLFTGIITMLALYVFNITGPLGEFTTALICYGGFIKILVRAMQTCEDKDYE